MVAPASPTVSFDTSEPDYDSVAQTWANRIPVIVTPASGTSTLNLRRRLINENGDVYVERTDGPEVVISRGMPGGSAVQYNDFSVPLGIVAEYSGQGVSSADEAGSWSGWVR